MKIAIVDDEKLWRNTAVKEISAYYPKDEVIIQVYACGERLLQAGKQYEIVFLDVEMEKLDGFQTAIKYKEKYPESIIIMFTMHIELSRKGYMVNAFRYIDKTKMSKEIPEALESAERLLERNQKIEFNVVNLGVIRLMVKDILFIETEKRNIKIHTRVKEYICSDSISDIEQKVIKCGFYRCHKSYIVNLDAIESFDHIYVYMIDGSKAMVSARKYTELRREYLERKYNKANG